MEKKSNVKDQNTEIGLRLLEGDEGVIDKILRIYGPQIFAFLLRKYDTVFNEADIEDVLSIATFRLWQARNAYDESRGSVRVWFFKIADNAAKDVLKLGWQKARMLEIVVDSYEFDGLAVYQDNIGEQTKKEPQHAKMFKDVRKILEALPDVQRRILKADAHARDGKAETRALAAELGLPVGTVRIYRKRGIDRMKEEMRKLGYDVP